MMLFAMKTLNVFIVRFDPSFVSYNGRFLYVKAVFPVACHVHLSVHACIFLFCRYLGGPVPLQSFKLFIIWRQKYARPDWLFSCQDRASFSCNDRSLLARCPRHTQSVLNLIVDIHVMVNWQLSKRVSADQCHLTVSQAQLFSSLRLTCLSFPLTSCWF